MPQPSAISVQRDAGCAPGGPVVVPSPRRFEFGRDTFSFANQLIWGYTFDDVSGKTLFSRRDPPGTYTHHCFVLVRASRQFFYHARFDESGSPPDREACRRLIRRVVARDPRQPCEPGQEIVIPGYKGLRDFSTAQEAVLKQECGGAWQSYVMRSHWRMIFPISRIHQERTAASLISAVREKGPPIVHVVRFPALTINHGVVIFSAAETESGVQFEVYDPNYPEKPALMMFDRAARTFTFPRNSYWIGGRLNVIEIYKGWFI